MNYTVFGIFADRQNAEDGIQHLQEDGYNPKNISILMKDTAQARDLTQSTGTNVTGGAVNGIATGAVLGGLAGLLIGIGAIAVPGIGGLLIAGPLATALGLGGAAATTVSGAATGAVAGGLIGALMGLGVSEPQARIYEEQLREGGILVAVACETDESAQEICDILAEYNATNIDTISDETRLGKRHSAHAQRSYTNNNHRHAAHA